VVNGEFLLSEICYMCGASKYAEIKRRCGKVGGQTLVWFCYEKADIHVSCVSSKANDAAKE
jgi:hypothetical protein